MEIEFHQLDLRYQALRRRDPKKERQVLASVAEVGQLLPVVVVGASQAGHYVLLDGFKRLRALRRLHSDTVRATVWALDEAEALLLERRMRHGEPESALEQGWLLHELTDRFGLSQPELARRFDRTVSWVSRRLALVTELPAAIQEHVRSGAIAAHAAMKYLAPLARAKREECERLAAAIAAAQLSTRQVGELYVGWKSGSERTRELLLSDPLLYLRAQAEARRPDAPAKSPGALLLDDMALLGTVARRTYRRLCAGSLRAVLPSEREEIGRALEQATADLRTLGTRWEKEIKDAGRGDAGRDPQAA
jgi:ParB family transcriptional regulator, chromosome partitioning protein